MQTVPITAIVLTYNEEALIADCLESLIGLAEQIVVVDSGSTDRTLDIVANFGVDVLSHAFENYSAQRRWSQSQNVVKHDWVLHIDADERLTPELQQSIRNVFEQELNKQYQGFLIARRTVFMGRWIKHGGHYPVYHLRLFERERGSCEDRLYDQHFVVEGNVTKIDGDIIDTIATDLDSWTKRHLRWAALEVQEVERERVVNDRLVQAKLDGTPVEQRRWLRQSVYDRMPLFVRSIGYFFFRYFLRLGFLDGVEGLVFHVLQGFWFRFYVDAKLYEIRHKSRKS